MATTPARRSAKHAPVNDEVPVLVGLGRVEGYEHVEREGNVHARVDRKQRTRERLYPGAEGSGARIE